MVPVLGGFRLIGWLLLGGLLVAVLVVAVVLWLQHRGSDGQRKAVKSVAALSDLDSTTPRPDQSSAEELWRQADESARAGRFLEAVRAVYLGVLALLHRANLIRYERTRTNGEYLNQLRPHTELQGPFGHLTSIFEIKFYGERSCQPDDYSACRAIAQNILADVRGQPTHQ